MKCWVVIEVDRTNTTRKDIDHPHSHHLAVDEVLLVEGTEALIGDIEDELQTNKEPELRLVGSCRGTS